MVRQAKTDKSNKEQWQTQSPTNQEEGQARTGHWVPGYVLQGWQGELKTGAGKVR